MHLATALCSAPHGFFFLWPTCSDVFANSPKPVAIRNNWEFMVSHYEYDDASVVKGCTRLGIAAAGGSSCFVACSAIQNSIPLLMQTGQQCSGASWPCSPGVPLLSSFSLQVQRCGGPMLYSQRKGAAKRQAVGSLSVAILGWSSRTVPGTLAGASSST